MFFSGINARGTTSLKIYNNTFYGHNEATGLGKQFLYLTVGAGGLVNQKCSNKE